MNGPVQGVATKAASAPVAKAPVRPLRQPSAERGQLEQSGEVEGDGGDEQKQEQDHPRILELEGPADRRPSGPDREQQGAEREAGEDGAGRVGERLAPGGAFLAAGAGEAQRLEAEDREDAGHDVEQQAAEQRAGEGEEHGPPAAAVARGGRSDRGAGGSDLAGQGAKRKPLPRRELQHAFERGGRAVPGPCLDDQPVAPPRHRLRRGIDQGLLGDRVEIGIVERHRRGQRDGQPEPSPLRSNRAASGSGLGSAWR